MQWILLGIGGAAGTLLRYSVTSYAGAWNSGQFPLGTFIVNIIGSFLIGLAFGLSEHLSAKNSMRLFVFTGLLGGFTTFSAFSLESIQLIKAGDNLTALLYILLSNVMGVVLAFAGYLMGRYMLKAMNITA